MGTSGVLSSLLLTGYREGRLRLQGSSLAMEKGGVEPESSSLAMEKGGTDCRDSHWLWRRERDFRVPHWLWGGES